MRKRFSLLLLLLSLTGAAAAETIYVNDQLRLGVRPEPGKGSTLEVVLTGTPLQVLEREGNYIKVRTEKGNEGWVAKIYTSEELPAAQQLAALREEFEAQQQQLAGLQEGQSGVLEENERFAGEISALKLERAEMSGELEELRSRVGDEQRVRFWAIMAGVMALLFILGVVVGARSHSKKVSRRFGGLKV